jgi:hypothetical protein
MKRISLYLVAFILLGTACRKIEVDGPSDNNNGNNNNTNENTILEGRITSNRTLKADYVYKLRGLVYVTNGAVLTIEPGTKIVGEQGRNGGLIITRSCKIIADGTPDKPIVFTSEASTPNRGDWAGLVILGNAPTNASFNGQAGIGEIEGGINNSDGLGLYGLGSSSNPADNSGILRYVRIEYAGYAFLPDKEINGLTLGGVGNQTLIDHVQVSYANDDSFEWFGGTVNCKHLISYKALDDDFDSDNGFAGKVQFGIALRDSLIADISGSNCFESDNDAGGSINTPQTSAVFSNFTLVGPKPTLTSTANSNYRRGLHIRRNSSISVFNSIVMGWPTGWLLDASTGTPTDLNLTSATPRAVFANNIIAGNNTQLSYTVSASAPTGWNTTEFTNYMNRANGGNTLLPATADVNLTAPFKYDNTVDFNPASGSPALSGASFTDPKLSSGFTATAFRGACDGADSWWKVWTKFQ